MRHAAATGAGPPRGGDAVAATSGRLSSRARAVLRGELACHPAVAAWRELVPDAPDPERIEVLRQGKKSTTYRLVESTPGGASIIAQRACMAKALIERTVYEDILPHLPITSPRYYGCRAADPHFAWLFLEDIGDERYTPTDRAQLALAGHWVGLMHTAAARVPAARGFPEGGPPRYLDHLRADLQTIRANLANPALTAGDAATLGRLASDLDRLEGAWAALACACTGLPATLVHGDLQRKNLYVRNGAGQSALYAIDWETAGWGIPAADLARIDLPTYWSVRSEEHTLNSSHPSISYAVFCLKKKTRTQRRVKPAGAVILCLANSDARRSCRQRCGGHTICEGIRGT